MLVHASVGIEDVLIEGSEAFDAVDRVLRAFSHKAFGAVGRVICRCFLHFLQALSTGNGVRIQVGHRSTDTRPRMS